MWKRTEPEPRPGSLFHAGAYMSRAEVGTRGLGISPCGWFDTNTRHQREKRKAVRRMRIEDVKTPTLPLADACEILRCEGYRMSVDKLKAGIFGGVYPFGEVIDRVEGLTKNDCYTVYTAFLQKWIEERRVG